MCKECHEYTEYKSFDELPQELKDKFKPTKITKQSKQGFLNFINELNKHGDVLIGNYVNNSTKTLIKFGKCGHIPSEGMRSNNYMNGNRCAICHGMQVEQELNDLATKRPDLAKQWHPTKNGDLKPTQVACGSGKKVWWQCEKGHEWEAMIYSRNSGDSNCPYCANYNCKVLKGFNDIATTHPQYIKYFVNIEDAYTHTYASSDKVEMKCPNCGMIKVMRTVDLIRKGFGCTECGDGVKYPEKVLALLLDSLNIKFKKQLKFDGHKFLYDFYLIDYDIIIEVHGGQHYESGWKSYEEEHENDLIKYDIAVLNGYEYNKNYFVIDARKSNIEWLRNSINHCLFFQQFDLSNIDWEEIDIQAQNSKKVEVCLYWKEQKEVNKDLTTTIMAEIFNVERNTIRIWLKWGNKSGLCIYNSEEESKAQKRRMSKFVYLIKPDGTKEYDEAMSQNKLAIQIGISRHTIKDRLKDGKPIKGNSKYKGYYIIEEDKLEEFLLNLKGGDIIE